MVAGKRRAELTGRAFFCRESLPGHWQGTQRTVSTGWVLRFVSPSTFSVRSLVPAPRQVDTDRLSRAFESHGGVVTATSRVGTLGTARTSNWHAHKKDER